MSPPVSVKYSCPKQHSLEKVKTSSAVVQVTSVFVFLYFTVVKNLIV